MFFMSSWVAEHGESAKVRIGQGQQKAAAALRSAAAFQKGGRDTQPAGQCRRKIHVAGGALRKCSRICNTRNAGLLASAVEYFRSGLF